MINLQYSVAFISSRCALQRLRRSIRFPSIFVFLMIFCRKTQSTNAKSGRPKVADWKVAMWKKITGRLVSKWERTGRNWSNFAHRHTDPRVNLSSIDAQVSVIQRRNIYGQRQLFTTGMDFMSSFLPPPLSLSLPVLVSTTNTIFYTTCLLHNIKKTFHLLQSSRVNSEVVSTFSSSKKGEISTC